LNEDLPNFLFLIVFYYGAKLTPAKRCCKQPRHSHPQEKMLRGWGCGQTVGDQTVVVVVKL
jgi:hypothetical protein